MEPNYINEYLPIILEKVPYLGNIFSIGSMVLMIFGIGKILIEINKTHSYL